MAGLAAAALLVAWESVRTAWQSGQPPHWDARNATLLRAFGSPVPDNIGARQAALLGVYAENFADRLSGLATCPGCGTEVELDVPVVELTAAASPTAEVEPLESEGRTVHWRLPAGEDLADAADCADASEGALLLASRCLVDPVPVTADLREALARRIAAADPLAEISFTLTCPACEQRWDSPLDIGEFMWRRLEAGAWRLLREVDELARCYGWSEERILALSPARRQGYLDLVRDG
jgi:hypothetical protein